MRAAPCAPAHHLGGSLVVHRPVEQVLRHILAAAISEHRVDVAAVEGAKAQALGLDRVVRAESRVRKRA